MKEENKENNNNIIINKAHNIKLNVFVIDLFYK